MSSPSHVTSLGIDSPAANTVLVRSRAGLPTIPGGAEVRGALGAQALTPNETRATESESTPSFLIPMCLPVSAARGGRLWTVILLSSKTGLRRGPRLPPGLLFGLFPCLRHRLFRCGVSADDAAYRSDKRRYATPTPYQPGGERHRALYRRPCRGSDGFAGLLVVSFRFGQRSARGHPGGGHLTAQKHQPVPALLGVRCVGGDEVGVDQHNRR